MFDIGWSELVVIGVVALVVIGPKDLPRVMRTVGQWSGKVKRMAREFQNQFNEALREAELEDVKKEVEEIGKVDPLADVNRELASIAPKAESAAAKIETPPPPAAEPHVMKPLDKPAESAAPVAPPEPLPVAGDKP